MDNRLPLLGVTAFVDVHSKHANHSRAVSEELRKLGAVVSDKLLTTVTHIVFKDGSKTTEAKAMKFGTLIVSVSWVDRCKQENAKVPEHLYSMSACSTGKRKQKSMQPKDFDEELRLVSARLAKRKKRRSNVQIPSPLKIIADRIDLNAYIQAPRTPPAMQKKLDELRARNALSSKLATSDKPPSRGMEKGLRASIGTSPELQPSQKGAEVVVPFTVFKGQRCTQDPDVVPETPLNWNISSRLNLTPSPELNTSIECEKTADDAANMSDSLSPALDWNASISSFLNEKLSHSEISAAVGVNIPSSSGTDDTVGIQDDCVTQIKPFENRTNQKSVVDNEAGANTSDVTSLVKPKVGKSFKKKIRFVPPFLKDKENIPENVVSSLTVSDRPASHIGQPLNTKPSTSVSDLLALHSNAIRSDCIPNGTQRTQHAKPELVSMPSSARTKPHHKFATRLPALVIDKRPRKPLNETPSGDDTSIDVIGSGFKGIRKTVSRVNLKSSKTQQQLDHQRDNDEDLHSSEKTSSLSNDEVAPVLASSETSIDLGPTNNSLINTEIHNASTGSIADRFTRNELVPRKGKDISSTENIAPRSRSLSTALRNRKDSSAINKQRGRKSRIVSAVSSTPDVNRSVSAVSSTPDVNRSVSAVSSTPDVNRSVSAVSSTPDVNRSVSAVSSTPDVNRSVSAVSSTPDVNRSVSAVSSTPDVNRSVSAVSSTPDVNRSVSAVSSTPDVNRSVSAVSSTPDVNRSVSSNCEASTRQDTRVIANVSSSSADSGVDSSSLGPNSEKKGGSNENSSATVLDEDEIFLCDSSPPSHNRANRINRKTARTSWREISCSTPNLVLTSLHSGERSMVKTVIKSLGGYEISLSVNQYTTHVVCGNNRRTINALKGISCGCWMVSVEWVLISLEAGKWERNEQKYLMSKFFTGANLQRRHHIMTEGNKLLRRVGPIYVAHGTNPSPHDLSELLQLNGGKVVRTRRACRLMIGSAADVTNRQTVIKESWILDCVAQQRLLDYRPYQHVNTSPHTDVTCDIFDCS